VRKKRGRQSLLTDELEERVLSAIRAGNFRNVAAQWAGISLRTFKDWMKKGKLKPASRQGIFCTRVIEAEKGAEMRMVALIMKAATSDAKHAQWWLERKHSARWGRKDTYRHDVGMDVTSNGASLLTGLSLQELKALAKKKG
jgi:hypothetical protein